MACLPAAANVDEDGPAELLLFCGTIANTFQAGNGSSPCVCVRESQAKRRTVRHDFVVLSIHVRPAQVSAASDLLAASALPFSDAQPCHVAVRVGQSPASAFMPGRAHGRADSPTKM